MYKLYDLPTIQDNNHNYCVYCHLNKINGKRYIGQTCQKPTRRWKSGGGYKEHPYFYRAIQKYGWNNFEHYIIQDGLTKEEANILENLNIIAYNTINSNFGYNLTTGGEQPTFSEETRQKLSEMRKGEKHHLYGKHLSEETKQRISKANKGRKLSDDVKLKLSKSHKGKNNPRYGCHLSKETKEKISKHHKGMSGKKHSDITRQHISDGLKGTHNVLGKKWINNGIETKYINAEDLEQYINNGWVCGRIANGKIGKHTKPTIPWNKGKHIKLDI